MNTVKQKEQTYKTFGHNHLTQPIKLQQLVVLHLDGLSTV